MNYFQFPVSFGTVLIFWNAHGSLSRIELSYDRLSHVQTLMVPFELSDTIRRIRNYFYQGTPAGSVSWDCIDLSELSDFQRQVYQMTCQVPYGETRTYGWIARQIGKPSASRAVGQALRNNPFPILVPCHRIIATHSMGGFMGELDPEQPNMQLKQTLISMEEEYLNPVFSFLPPMMRPGISGATSNLQS